MIAFVPLVRFLRLPKILHYYFDLYQKTAPNMPRQSSLPRAWLGSVSCCYVELPFVLILRGTAAVVACCGFYEDQLKEGGEHSSDLQLKHVSLRALREEGCCVCPRFSIFDFKMSRLSVQLSEICHIHIRTVPTSQTNEMRKQQQQP